jgi:hypothetical protein
MRPLSSGFGMGPGTIGTLGFMHSRAKSDSPEFRKLQGVQRTLQFAMPRNQNMIDLMAYDTILSNLEPGSQEYKQMMAKRNALMSGFGNPALQGFGSKSKNPKLQFAVGVLQIVQRFLGVW